METRPCVIIHGWSDHSDSFKPLAQAITTTLQLPATLIHLADYVSEDDEVDYNDLVTVLSRAWQENKLPTSPGSVDVIVHSTAGLIIRHWLANNYTPQTAPIKHLVMLAPANFGSPLAHKGLSFFGRVLKGAQSDKPFQVGEQLLKGLELGSPYSFELALRDRFSTTSFYGPGAVLCTVLVGNHGYEGVASLANDEGSDGTVRASGANMNCAKLLMDFSEDPLNPHFDLQLSTGSTAFGLMSGENHSTIANKLTGFANSDTLPTICKALQIDDANFPAWCDELSQKSKKITFATHLDQTSQGYQEIITHAINQFNQPIDDYFLAFYKKEDSVYHKFGEHFHRHALRSTHVYGDDASYRNLYIDCSIVYDQMSKSPLPLSLSLAAAPALAQADSKSVVGYRSFMNNGINKELGVLQLSSDLVQHYFVPNRSLLLTIKLKREQSDAIFKITP